MPSKNPRDLATALVRQLFALGSVVALGGCASTAAMTPAGEPAKPTPASTSPSMVADTPAPPAEAAPVPATNAPAEIATSATATPQIEYRARLTDGSFTRREKVNHLEWTCNQGFCRASGPELKVSGKTCATLGYTLGAVVDSFEWGNQSLGGRDLEYCRKTLAEAERSGALAKVRRRQEVADQSQSTLGAGESYWQISGSDGQSEAYGGGLRFVFADGQVALLRPNGQVFRFDADRRLVDHGKFVRWYSPQGYYTSSEVLSRAIRDRCPAARIRIGIVPGQLRHSSSRMPACQVREDVRLIFQRTPTVAPADQQAASQTLFAAPYTQDAGWKPAAKGGAVPKVVVGSAQSEPGYFGGQAHDLLEKIERVVTSCVRAYRPQFVGPTDQGELLLLVGAYGSARTAFVRRVTYDSPERLNACIEQQAMKLTYQSTGDVLIRIPFDLVTK